MTILARLRREDLERFGDERAGELDVGDLDPELGVAGAERRDEPFELDVGARLAAAVADEKHGGLNHAAPRIRGGPGTRGRTGL